MNLTDDEKNSEEYNIWETTFKKQNVTYEDYKEALPFLESAKQIFSDKKKLLNDNKIVQNNEEDQLNIIKIAILENKKKKKKIMEKKIEGYSKNRIEIDKKFSINRPDEYAKFDYNDRKQRKDFLESFKRQYIFDSDTLEIKSKKKRINYILKRVNYLENKYSLEQLTNKLQNYNYTDAQDKEKDIQLKKQTSEIISDIELSWEEDFKDEFGKCLETIFRKENSTDVFNEEDIVNYRTCSERINDNKGEIGFIQYIDNKREEFKKNQTLYKDLFLKRNKDEQNKKTKILDARYEFEQDRKILNLINAKYNIELDIDHKSEKLLDIKSFVQNKIDRMLSELYKELDYSDNIHNDDNLIELITNIFVCNISLLKLLYFTMSVKTLSLKFVIETFQDFDSRSELLLMHNFKKTKHRQKLDHKILKLYASRSSESADLESILFCGKSYTYKELTSLITYFNRSIIQPIFQIYYDITDHNGNVLLPNQMQITSTIIDESIEKRKNLYLYIIRRLLTVSLNQEQDFVSEYWHKLIFDNQLGNILSIHSIKTFKYAEGNLQTEDEPRYMDLIRVCTYFEEKFLDDESIFVTHKPPNIDIYDSNLSFLEISYNGEKMPDYLTEAFSYDINEYNLNMFVKDIKDIKIDSKFKQLVLDIYLYCLQYNQSYATNNEERYILNGGKM